MCCAFETCRKRFYVYWVCWNINHNVLLSSACNWVDKCFIKQFHWTRSVLLLSLLYFDLLQVDSPSATGLFPSNKGSIIKFLEQVRRWQCSFFSRWCFSVSYSFQTKEESNTSTSFKNEDGQREGSAENSITPRVCVCFFPSLCLWPWD